MAKTKRETETPPPIGVRIRTALSNLSRKDGLKRTQRWLAAQIGMGEVLLSNKINNNDFTEEEVKKINDVLSTDF